MIAQLSYDETPPSVNALATAHWRKYQRAKQRWEAIAAAMLLEAAVPRGVGSVEARAELRFAVRRRRDEGNFRMLLEKALGDALVSGGWLPDDTPDRYTFGALVFDPNTGPPRTLLTLTVRETALTSR